MAFPRLTKPYHHGHLLIWGAVDPSVVNTSHLNHWWTYEHLPERLSIPGFLKAKRYVSTSTLDSLPSYLVWYETSTLSVLASDAYLEKLNNPTDGTKRWVPVLARLEREACRVVKIVVADGVADVVSKGGRYDGGTLGHVVFTPPSEDEGKSRVMELLERECSSDKLAERGIVSMQLLEGDKNVTGVGSGSKSYEEVEFSKTKEDEEGKWMVVVEFAEADSGQNGRRSEELVQGLVDGLEAQEVKLLSRKMYRLICSANSSL